MRRILEPGQIEDSAQRKIPRLRLPDRDSVFSARAARLRKQSEDGAIGHCIGDYLKLMAQLADVQQHIVADIEPSLPTTQQMARAIEFRMPLMSPIEQSVWKWRRAVISICDSLAAVANLPQQVRAACDRLRAMEPEQIEVQAHALLGAPPTVNDAASAPFLMAALQVYWVSLASRVHVDDIPEIDLPGLCPLCGTQPVASIVRADSQSQGFRYLHCSLCATEWHMVRVKCSNCQTTKGISYQSIENGPTAIRAECCDSCRTYRKILYQEHDAQVEPVADDLASLPLDLLLSEAGYRRASANPLLANPG